MNPKLLLFASVLVLGLASARAGTMYIIDEEDLQHLQRVRRDIAGVEAPGMLPQLRRDLDGAPQTYSPASELPSRELMYSPVPIGQYGEAAEERSSYEPKGYHHKPGKVGPVYTFVKTDPYAHVKWGVRHVAGKKYGR